MTKKSIFSASWVRASEYELISNVYIQPKKGATFEEYDPIFENNLKIKNKSPEIFSELMSIHEEKNHNQQIRLIMNFVNNWGLPGTLLHDVDEIVLHPCFLNTQWDLKSKKNKVSKFNLFNPTKHFVRENTVFTEYEDDNLKLGDKEKIFHESLMSRLSWSINQEDFPASVTQSLSDGLSNKDTFYAQQVKYKRINGKWRIFVRYLDVKNLNKNVKPFEIVDPKEIIGTYEEPGFYFTPREQQTFEKILVENNPLSVIQDFLPQKRKFKSFKKRKFKYLTGSSLEKDERGYERVILSEKNRDPLNGYDFSEGYSDTNDSDTGMCFLDAFSKIRYNFKSNNEEEEQTKNNEFFWPMPETPYFNRSYGEYIHQIISLSDQVSTMFKRFDDFMNFFSFGDKENEDAFNSTIETFVSKLSPKMEIINGVKQFKLSSPSLIGYIGFIINDNLTSDLHARKCQFCNRFISNPARAKTTTCSEAHADALRKRVMRDKNRKKEGRSKYQRRKKHLSII